MIRLALFVIALVPSCLTAFSGLTAPSLRTTTSSEHTTPSPLRSSDDCRDYAHLADQKTVDSSVSRKLDELVKEVVCHGTHYEYQHRFEASLRRDGVAVIPELTNRFASYDQLGDVVEQTRESFFVLVVVADDLDNYVIRLRGTREGRELIDSLQAALDRLRKRGVSAGSLKQFNDFLQNFRGVNVIDQYVVNSLEESYGIRILDKEQLELSNFLVSVDPSYPTWSEIDEKGVLTFKDAKKFYSAYLRLKKS